MMMMIAQCLPVFFSQADESHVELLFSSKASRTLITPARDDMNISLMSFMDAFDVWSMTVPWLVFILSSKRTNVFF